MVAPRDARSASLTADLLTLLQGASFTVYISCDGLVTVRSDRASGQPAILSRRCKTRHGFAEYSRPRSAAIYNFDRCARLDGSVLYFLDRDDTICKVDLEQALYEVREVAKCSRAVDFDLLAGLRPKLVVAVASNGRIDLVDENGGTIDPSHFAQVQLESAESVISCCAADRKNLFAVAEWNPKAELAWIKVYQFFGPPAHQPTKPSPTAVRSESEYSRRV